MDKCNDTVSPWAQLLGDQTVPDVKTPSAVLVVSGQRCASLQDILRAVGLDPQHSIDLLNSVDGGNDLTETLSLARKYYLRLCRLQGTQPLARTECFPKQPKATPDTQLTAKQLRQRKYYLAHRDALLDEHKDRYCDKPAAQRHAERMAREASRACMLSERLAAIDADTTLTSKQKTQRRYLARNPEAAKARAHQGYLRRKAAKKGQSCA